MLLFLFSRNDGFRHYLKNALMNGMDENEFLGLPPEQSTPKILRQRKLLLALSGLVFILACIFLYQLFAPASFDSNDISFEIEKGASVRNVATDLHSSGIIRSPDIFEWYARLARVSGSIRAGNYLLRKDMNIPEIVNIMSSNFASDEFTLTVPEGWTVKDIASALKEKDGILESAFLTETKKGYAADFPFLQTVKEPSSSIAQSDFYRLQGFLFPDTYRFFKDSTPADIVQKMLGNFDQKLSQNIRNEIILQRKTIFEIVTMASLIEREVRTPEDKAVVSGILWKRISLGIPLQVDATIVFLKSDGQSQLDHGKVLLEDLKINSPYNTYLNRGLPPGPISNPGLASIEAAVYPKTSPYLYYLSAPDGTTIFSKTLDEHNAAKAKYLK
jgi:UPF0755 protein